MPAAPHAQIRPRGGRLRRAPWSLIVLGVLYTGIVGVQIGATGHPELEAPMFGLCFLLLNLLGVGFATRAAFSRRLDPATRRPWRYMAAAMVLHTGATAGFTVAAVAGIPAVEWVGIVSRLSMVPMLLASILTFPMRRLTPPERLKLSLDVTTVAGGGFIVMWYFIIGPALNSGESALVAVPLAGFPLGDLVLIFGVCAVLMRGGATSIRHPLTILLAGLVVYLAADVYYSHAELYDRGAPLSLVTRVWLLGGTLLIVVAAAQRMRRTTDVQPTRPARAADGGGGVSQLPYAGLATGYLLLLIATAREGSFFPWGGLVVGVIVMTGAVAIRQLIAMRENHKLVVTDSLTGLANRVRLRARLEQILGRQQPVAVLLIDLDGFKQVNDTLGHEAGDALLVAFAGVLTESVRPSDTASRLGGDEFAVVLPDITDVDQAGVVAARILAAAAVPVPLADTTVPIRSSIGIALARPGDDLQSLLHRADVAMYAAKRAGRHGWLAYADTMEQKLEQDAELLRDLAGALAAGQLRAFYRPITTLSDGEITAVEAVVSWEHPTHGLLTPEVLLPIAERSGAIHDIGTWVLDQTCRQVSGWQQTLPDIRPLSACVKLSPQQLQRPNVVTDLLAVVARTGLNPHDLVIELADGAPVDDEQTVAALRALREHGIRIAVDEFSGGYPSLHRLTRLPVDILKLDRCFVAELNGGPEDAAVAEAMVRLSRVLRLDKATVGLEATRVPGRSGSPGDQTYPAAHPMPADALGDLLHATVTSAA